MKNTIVITILILSSFIIKGQDCFTLKMSIKTEGLPAEYAAYGEQDIVTYVKGDKTKTEVNSMMFSTLIYFDGKLFTSLSDAMGNKTGYTATKEEMDAFDKEKKDKLEKPKIEYTSDKKTIVGYECTKAIVTNFDKDKKENKTIVWVTDKIKINAEALRKGSGRGTTDLGDLKGQPMEMEMSMNNQGMEMKVRMTTTEILTTAIDDSVFIPNTDGYTMSGYKDWIEKMKAMSGRR